jgi:hypothetical protein
MKSSNVSFENLLDQLSEDKINRVVDRGALRAGGLDLILGGGGGGGGCASSTGSKNTDTHSSTTSSANCQCGGGGGIFGLGL